mmetsp:Transcript_8087/g.11776  ORF Transcript_8087/g.11776 Transcript_8087/m.11776 type:complete len:1158 (-) Transcript_8087:98-3571(-)
MIPRPIPIIIHNNSTAITVCSSSSSSNLEHSNTETPILLTRSLHKRSSLSRGSILSGSIHDIEVAETNHAIVYSWGTGIQSLHDDSCDKTVEESRLNLDSRIGKPGAPAILSVATSCTHTACATSTGTVLTCGLNEEGAVDPHRKTDVRIERPTLLESIGPNRIVQVSCGLNHTAGLSANGSVLTWGNNQYGQLGHRRPFSTVESEEVPVKFIPPKGMSLGGGRRAAAVACGHNFTLVLTTRMSVLACGINSIAGYNNEEKGPAMPSPLPALEGLPLVSIAAGDSHAVVVTAHGTAFAWGNNQSGCCGRPYPTTLLLPVPVRVPETTFESLGSKRPFPNWGTWKNNGSACDAVSLAEDVAVVHAACGREHTVLVTQSGRLLVCGANHDWQLGLDMEANSRVSPLEPVEHPNSTSGGSFITAEAGDEHTLLLDNKGCAWQMGNGKPLKCVLTDTKAILTIAAGGKQSIAVAPGSKGATKRKFSVSSDRITIDESQNMAQTVEDLIEHVIREEKHIEDLGMNDSNMCPSGQELANRTEELLMYPAVINSVFLNSSELNDIHQKMVSVTNLKVRKAIATAVERGMKMGLEQMRPSSARMIYPEAVRCLLLYIQFFDRDDNDSLVFDGSGDLIKALCDTILNLPFEGYKAFLTWATTMYPHDLFVRMLVRPLLNQLNKALTVVKGADGVEHNRRSRQAAPMLVAVLKWLYNAAELSKGNSVQIAKPEDFYSVGVSNLSLEALYTDFETMQKANELQRSSHFFFCANPFLLLPETKRNLLQIVNKVKMYKVATENVTYNEEEKQYEIDPYFILEIERDDLLDQALEKVKHTDSSQLRKELKVVFKGEQGIDAGGVTKEFFQLLSEELFDVHSGLWTTRYGDHVTWFNSDCTWEKDEVYELVGVLVGLALYNCVLLDVHFPIALYRKLLGMPLGLEDMVDEELKKGLQQLLDYPHDDVEYVFCLNFEVTVLELGQEQKIELKEGGSDIPVTNDNKEEYVLLYVKWLLVDSVQPQWDAFENGIMRVMEASSLDLFRPEELQLLVVGSPNLDFAALERNTKYEGGYDKESNVVRCFWRFVNETTPTQEQTQVQLLKFATGSKMAPIGGLGNLPFKIQRAGPDSSQLPTSHTCFNTLLLPDYGDDYEKLKDRLGRAILECEGFGLQ